MPPPIEISRTDHTPEALERLSRECKDDAFARRLRALSMVLRGAGRMEVARAQGVDRQTVHDWVRRFNEAGPDGLRDQPRGGSSCRLRTEQQEELVAVLETGPDLEREGICRWRLVDLSDWIQNHFGVKYTLEGVRGLIHRLGFRNLSIAVGTLVSQRPPHRSGRARQGIRLLPSVRRPSELSPHKRRLAHRRGREASCDTLTWRSVQYVLRIPFLPLAPVLPSTDSAEVATPLCSPASTVL